MNNPTDHQINLISYQYLLQNKRKNNTLKHTWDAMCWYVVSGNSPPVTLPMRLYVAMHRSRTGPLLMS